MEFVVRVSKAKMPSSCWGRYEHVAVMAVDDGYRPPAIDTRLKRVKLIVWCNSKLHAGKTARSAAWQAKLYACALRDELEQAANLLQRHGFEVKPKE